MTGENALLDVKDATTDCSAVSVCRYGSYSFSSFSWCASFGVGIGGGAALGMSPDFLGGFAV